MGYENLCQWHPQLGAVAQLVTYQDYDFRKRYQESCRVKLSQASLCCCTAQISDYRLFYKMSNSHPLRPFTSVGEIDHVHILSEHIGALLIGEEYGDVTFVVEKKRFPAHRVILAARCQYFRALLYGGMRESQPEAEIPLQDTTAEAFTMLLKYIYTGRATLTDEKEEVLLDFLSLAHKYGFPELEDSTSEYLCTILNIQNVCMTFDVASLYSLPKLTCMCCMFMDRNAQEVLSSEGFLSLSKTALLNIVLRDSFAAPEKDIFLALLNWCKHNSKENHVEIMQAVRLPLMSLTELLNVVRPSGLLSPDAILDAIKVRSESRDMDLNYRGMLIPEENIATMKYGAQVVKGELKSALLDGDTQNYDLDHGFSRHPIDDDCRSGIEIKLGQPSIINHIRILLWDRDSRSYSYFIEVSMDELDWIRVIDHSQYLCRSWQKLYFPARVCSSIDHIALMLLSLQDEYILELTNPFEKKNVFVTLPALIWPTGGLGRLSCNSKSGT
ncbi:BTB/POZ domain-containing protein 9 [Sciurus carolinensis]|uniref:BTB/POZ domain-containing protein 9 n=1 Tax=Sciurus carolinensis TaxID=30640 RepID=A0AA41SRG5_SCICA|nr:BTB/POZ domain-containing protein 9 [Sciurus carolinensis]